MLDRLATILTIILGVVTVGLFLVSLMPIAALIVIVVYTILVSFCIWYKWLYRQWSDSVSDAKVKAVISSFRRFVFAVLLAVIACCMTAESARSLLPTTIESRLATAFDDMLELKDARFGIARVELGRRSKGYKGATFVSRIRRKELDSIRARDVFVDALEPLGVMTSVAGNLIPVAVVLVLGLVAVDFLGTLVTQMRGG